MDWQSLVLGVNTGIVLFLLIDRFIDAIQKKRPDTDMRAVVGHVTDIWPATAQLCAAVQKASPSWHTIEIIKHTGNNITLNIKSAEGGDLSPAGRPPRLDS